MGYHVPVLTTLEQDRFWAITVPGHEAPVDVPANSSFALRSTDMKFRAYITADVNDDKKSVAELPWKLCFMNPMQEGAFELKHSNSGYVWIEPGSHVCHSTDHTHPFELRDREKVNVAIVTIKNPKDEL